MLNNMGLGFVFTARDLASGAIRNLERNFMSLDQKVGLGAERIQSSFQQLGVGLAVFTAGAVMLGGAFSLANAAGRFEQSIAAVAAVSGATTEELEQLRGAAIEAGVATQFSPTEASLGLRELAQAGFNAQESMQLLIPVLDLAAGSLGELSPQQAAGLASQAMKAFGIETNQAAITVDRMLQAVNVFALNANELPLALGTASRGAQAMNQSLSETLIALGLVKNVIPGVERASTAVAVSMERMADPEVQQKLRGLGVSVLDSQHRFRSFLDVLGDLAPALSKMNEAERSAFLLKTFGREALSGVNAMLMQVTSGIRTNTGVTVRGADAIAYLRDQFENAGGTAANFREKMLGTFEGQKKLLQGSMETLAIVAGEPFAQVFKPLVSILIEVVNAILGVFRQLPAPVKRAFAAFIVGAGAVVSLVGAVIAAKAGFALLVIGLKALGLTMGGLAATVLPAIAIFGLLAVAVAGFVLAFRNNVGGIADFFQRVGERVSLAFRGLMQLFNQGGFSGALRDELGRAENRGLKDFLVNVFLWTNRIQSFLSGIATGFSAGVAEARPTIEAFLGVLRRIGAAFGLLSERDSAAEATAKFREFGTTGARVGAVLSGVFEFLVQAMTAVAQIAQEVAEGWKLMDFGVLMSTLSQLGAKFGELFGQLFRVGGVVSQSGGVWVTLGTIISFTIGVAVRAISVLLSVLSVAVSFVGAAIGIIVSVFSGLADVITGVVFLIGGILGGGWANIWLGMKLVVFGVVDAIIAVVLELAGALAGIVDSFSGLFGNGTRWQAGIQGFRESIRAGMAEGMGVESLSFTRSESAPQGGASRVEQLPPPPPVGSSGGDGPLMSAADAPMPAAVALGAQSQTPIVVQAPSVPPAPPMTVNLQVDGQTLASVVHEADRDAATRSFSPVPAY